MNERIQKLIKSAIIIAALAFAVCCLIKKPQELGDYTSYLSYAMTVATTVFYIYEKWAWRRIPWNQPPILKEQYDGIIRYRFNGLAGEKPIRVHIKQTWSRIDVKTNTDINSSVTITAAIVNEYGQAVLYYTYMTNPSAATQKDNPIQYGSCRMVLRGDNKTIRGKYWTSSHTTGDMEWKAVETR